eukprot:TRINITY_DN9425_c1_g1_i1.p1 TRINITY_DN9425_c1_g1~~TRINITY_DN9425_c1_g1_i1.p1  ORF type:complete len:337 (-),score=97.19 TRINITY_DN9425_c1_g1_i1:7-1017(-)
MDAGTALRALLRPSLAASSAGRQQTQEHSSSAEAAFPADEDIASNSLVDLSLSDSEPSASPGASKKGESAFHQSQLDESRWTTKQVRVVQQDLQRGEQLDLQRHRQKLRDQHKQQLQRQRQPLPPGQNLEQLQQLQQQLQPQQEVQDPVQPLVQQCGHKGEQSIKPQQQLGQDPAAPCQPPQPFAWMRCLTWEQRQNLRRCSSPQSARRLLAGVTGSNASREGTPQGVLQELQRQTQLLLRQSLDLEEELSQQAVLHAAELAAVEEEHRRTKRRAKLQLLAQWAPHRSAAIEALSCEAQPSLRPAQAALTYGPGGPVEGAARGRRRSYSSTVRSSP